MCIACTESFAADFITTAESGNLAEMQKLLAAGAD
jgi:hypothetical protein